MWGWPQNWGTCSDTQVREVLVWVRAGLRQGGQSGGVEEGALSSLGGQGRVKCSAQVLGGPAATQRHPRRFVWNLHLKFRTERKSTQWVEFCESPSYDWPLQQWGNKATKLGWGCRVRTLRSSLPRRLRRGGYGGRRKPVRVHFKGGLVTGVWCCGAMRNEAYLVDLAAWTVSEAWWLLGPEQRVEEWMGSEEGETACVDAVVWLACVEPWGR